MLDEIRLADKPYEAIAFDDGQAANFSLQHERGSVGQRRIGRGRDRIVVHCILYRKRVQHLLLGTFPEAQRSQQDAAEQIPLETPEVPVSDLRNLERVVSLAFGMRRKTLRNSLKPVLTAAEIEAAGVDPGARPETLDLAAFAALANRVS